MMDARNCGFCGPCARGEYDNCETFPVSEYDKLKQERDELATQVEVMMNPRLWTSEMHDAWHLNLPDTQKSFEELRKSSITPSAAMREIQARTLDEFGEKYRLVYRSTGEFIGDVVQELAVHEAAEIRKGE